MTMLSERFGSAIADLVLAVTESDRTLSWEERKSEALEHVDSMSTEERALKSADVIANVADLFYDYEKEGDKIFERFGAPKEKFVEHYQRMIQKLLNYSDNPFSEDLKHLKTQMEEIL
jgi:hypothetical protein